MAENRKQIFVNRISIAFCRKRSMGRTSWCSTLTIEKSALLLLLQLVTNVLVQCVIERKLPRQTLIVGDSAKGKALSNGSQSNTLRRHMLLTFDICTSD